MSLAEDGDDFALADDFGFECLIGDRRMDQTKVTAVMTDCLGDRGGAFDDDLDLDVRTLLRKSRRSVSDDRSRQRRNGRHGEPAIPRAGNPGYSIMEGRDLVEQTLRLGVESLGICSRMKPPVPSTEELKSEIEFQLRDCLADRRLRDIEPGSCLGRAVCRDDCTENFQQPKIEAFCHNCEGPT